MTCGRPVFNDLLFHRRPAIYMPFDVLFADGADVRSALLKERRAILPKVVQRYGLQRCESVLGEGTTWPSSVSRIDISIGLNLMTCDSRSDNTMDQRQDFPMPRLSRSTARRYRRRPHRARRAWKLLCRNRTGAAACTNHVPFGPCTPNVTVELREVGISTTRVSNSV
jgi:hypothetical protein